MLLNFIFFIAHCVTIHFSTKKTKKKKMIWKAKDLKVHENSYSYSNVSTAYLMANKIILYDNEKLKLN